jgi:hypothetical protein
MVFLLVVHLPVSYCSTSNETAVTTTRICAGIAKFRLAALDDLGLLSQVRLSGAAVPSG